MSAEMESELKLFSSRVDKRKLEHHPGVAEPKIRSATYVYIPKYPSEILLPAFRVHQVGTQLATWDHVVVVDVHHCPPSRRTTPSSSRSTHATLSGTHSCLKMLHKGEKLTLQRPLAFQK